MTIDRLSILKRGVAIPASPLALDTNRKWDEKRQRALYRYYAAAGSGGVAVAVHSTQFEIREPKYSLFRPVLELAAEELALLEKSSGRSLLGIAGVCGRRDQALSEAELSRSLGYDAVLLSLAALKDASVNELLEHCRAVAEIIPVIGFYLQPAVGGRDLPYEFWREFADIPNVVAIKMAPFDRYKTNDVIRAVADSGRWNDITLYTGNDDNIIVDLLTPFRFGDRTLRIVGGLLGQWCVWTKTAVDLLEELHAIAEGKRELKPELLQRAAQLTDANAAVFDAKNRFAGCIPGIHEVLRRQGLLETNYCLNPHEVLSEGQTEELTRVCRQYPWLIDDDFVSKHLDEWLK